MPKRKANRLAEFNYSSNGAYFVTICSCNKEHIFGHIVGDAALGVPKIELTSIGKYVDEKIQTANNDLITIDKYVIMPNHIHLILLIDGGTPRAASPTKSLLA